MFQTKVRRQIQGSENKPKIKEQVQRFCVRNEIFFELHHAFEANINLMFATKLATLNLVVCILLRVLDQVQGFPSKTTLFQ
jgi:hypothetical protein